MCALFPPRQPAYYWLLVSALCTSSICPFLSFEGVCEHLGSQAIQLLLVAPPQLCIFIIIVMTELIIIMCLLDLPRILMYVCT